jgi:hypothetical protein
MVVIQAELYMCVCIAFVSSAGSDGKYSMLDGIAMLSGCHAVNILAPGR